VHIGKGAEADFGRVADLARGAILLVDAAVIQSRDDLDNEYDRALPIKQRALGARLSRAEISKLLDRTGLAKKMKLAGMWPAWEAGKRGRIP